MVLKEFENVKLPAAKRKSNATLFMIMFGFTFFSASMWVGQTLANGLDFKSFLLALLLGGMILGIYTGTLGYIGADSGLSLDKLAKHSFGQKGSWLPSAMIAITQTGWFGVGLAMFVVPLMSEIFKIPISEDFMSPVAYLLVGFTGLLMTSSAFFGIKSLTIVSYIAVPLVAILGTVSMIIAVKNGDCGLIEQFSKGTKDLSIIAGAGLVIGSFISGGTATPNFARYGKSGRNTALITACAFLIGNSLMFLFGAVSSIYVGGKDIFDVMLNLNMFWFAIIVLGLNIWTTNDNAIYSSGMSISSIFSTHKSTAVLFCGTIGTIFSFWLYWHFCDWLNILNCTLPPVGIIIILDYFINRKNYDEDGYKPKAVNWFSVTGVIIAAVCANLIKWGIPSINGIVIASVIYLVPELIKKSRMNSEQKASSL